MKKIEVELPDRVHAIAQEAIDEGYFASMDDLVRVSIMSYVRRPMLDLLVRQQMADLKAASAEAHEK